MRRESPLCVASLHKSGPHPAKVAPDWFIWIAQFVCFLTKAYKQSDWLFKMFMKKSSVEGDWRYLLWLLKGSVSTVMAAVLGAPGSHVGLCMMAFGVAVGFEVVAWGLPSRWNSKLRLSSSFFFLLHAKVVTFGPNGKYFNWDKILSLQGSLKVVCIVVFSFKKYNKVTWIIFIDILLPGGSFFY